MSQDTILISILVYTKIQFILHCHCRQSVFSCLHKNSANSSLSLQTACLFFYITLIKFKVTKFVMNLSLQQSLCFLFHPPAQMISPVIYSCTHTFLRSKHMLHYTNNREKDQQHSQRVLAHSICITVIGARFMSVVRILFIITWQTELHD